MRRSIYNIIKTTPYFEADKLIGIIAPHSCAGCGESGTTLCRLCQELAVDPPPPRCFNCQKVSKNYKTCTSCKRILSFDSLLHAGPYVGVHKKLILSMKKDASRASAKDIGSALALLVESSGAHLEDIDVIIPAPTITRHIRERGFDHTSQVAKEVSRQLGVPYLQVLERTSSTRQVGSSRRARFEQMENAVKLKEVKSLNGVKILLIDDIATTGATLSACTKVLKKAGASRVDAVVFASGN